MCKRHLLAGLMICGAAFCLTGCGSMLTKQPKPVDLLLTGTEGWEVVNGPADSWMFENGVLSTDGKIDVDGSWISTKGQYSDFLLELEYKISKGGNSGVFVRAPRSGDPAYEGLEIQIMDDRVGDARDLKPSQMTGAIYDIAAPQERVTKKAGLWQTMVIRCEGNMVKVQINGNLVTEVDLDEAKSQSGRTHVGLKRREGYIGFQNHKSPVQFRNVRITELP